MNPSQRHRREVAVVAAAAVGYMGDVADVEAGVAVHHIVDC